MLDRFVTAQVDVENFALITHTVPAERVRDHIPAELALETFRGDDGGELAFITTSCFCNRQLHWSMARYPAVDFDQSTFRTYVTYKGRRGSYFFGTYVSTRLSFGAQSLLAANSQRATYDISCHGGPAGYPRYTSRAVTSDGEIAFEIEATGRPQATPPFATGDEHAEYITHRLHGFARSPFGWVTHGPVQHRRMTPWSGRLLGARLDFWDRLGILAPEETVPEYSVLVEPSVRFTLHPPRIAH